MSYLPVIEYLAGLTVFGFVYWILDSIVTELKRTSISQTGYTYDLILYVWVGIILLYLIFGGMWVIRKYNEAEYQNRGGGQF